MNVLETPRLRLEPLAETAFEQFVTTMLTDPRVVEFYFDFHGVTAVDAIRTLANQQFLPYFEAANVHPDLGAWAAYAHDGDGSLVGWSGILETELSQRYGAPELQYMIAGDAHGRGYATEIAGRIVDYAAAATSLDSLMATVDIPNIGSVRVLEKLGFERQGQIFAYGSEDMYLYRRALS